MLHSLIKKGYEQGDCVGIHVPNCIEYPVSLLGTMAMGMVLTTSNPAYTHSELNTQMKSANAKVLFTNSRLMDTARKAADNTNLELLISIDESSVNDSGVVHLKDILENGDPNFTKQLLIDPHNDVALYLYSSGTTELPKCVMQTHHNAVSNILQLTECLGYAKNILGQLPMFHVGLPMFHVGGLTVVLSLHLYHGCTIPVLPSFDPETFLSAIEDYKVTHI